MTRASPILVLTVGMAVERVNGSDFLSVEEKADIFYHNAARFLGLTEEEVARHHARASEAGRGR